MPRKEILMLRWLRRLAAAGGVLACLGVGFAVRANTILVTFDGTTAGVSQPGATKFNYHADLVESSVNSQIQTGDFFTIYDFAGFIPGSTLQPANWTFASTLVGLTPLVPGPPVVLPADDPLLPNLTWVYTGTAPITTPPTLLGSFSAESIYPYRTVDNYTSQDHRDTNNNGVFLPTGYIDTTVVAAVPLPATANMGLILLGSVAGLGLVRRLRNGPGVVA